MKTYKGLPILNFVADDDSTITTISMVDEPAMEVGMYLFEKQDTKMTFSVVDESKHNAIACIVRVDYPIFRVDDNGNKFYGVFTKDAVEVLCSRLMTDGYQQNISLDHNGELIDGVQLQEVFIKDSSKGISPIGFDDVADGSLFGVFHFSDENIWKDCLDGKIGGPSIESYFKLEEFNKINKNKSNMSKIKDMLKSILMEFNKVATDKAELVWDGDEELAVGMAVFVETDGERTPAEDGEYATEDSIIKVEGGVVTAIDKKEEPETPVEEEKPAEEPAQEEMEEETPATEEPAQEPEKPAEEPNDDKVAELEARVAALEAKIEELVAKIAEIATAPAAEPVMEEFEKAAKAATGDKKLDKRIALAAALKDRK